MIAQLSRRGPQVAATSALLVLAGLRFGLADAEWEAPLLVADSASRSAEAEALTVRCPADDLDEVYAVAEAFAVAFYGDDLDELHQLSMDGFADRLLASRQGTATTWDRSRLGDDDPRHPARSRARGGGGPTRQRGR